MNELNITEYAALLSGVGVEPAVRSTSVEYNSSAATSELLNEVTGFVRLISDEDCLVRFTRGDADVKKGSSILLAGVPEYFSVSQPPMVIKVKEL